MLNVFAFPTRNSWEEDVFRLTSTGMITVILFIVVLVSLAIFFRAKETHSTKTNTKQLVFSALAMALAIVTSYMKIAHLPMGGSITLFSMLFITLIGYWYGSKAGLITALAYGLLQFILEPVFYSIPQMIVDYPLAFGALGLSGIFSGKKNGLVLGYITGVIGRYFFSVLSGILFFAHYAPEGTPALLYSLGYNASYIFPEAVITILLLALSPVVSAMSLVKKMATEA